MHYVPLYRQPYYRERYGEMHLPGAESYYAGALSLPLFPQMTDGEVARVIDAVSELITP